MEKAFKSSITDIIGGCMGEEWKTQMKHTERDRDRDRETERETEIERQTDRDRERRKDRDRQRHTETETGSERQTDRHRERNTERNKNRQTETHNREREVKAMALANRNEYRQRWVRGGMCGGCVEDVWAD